MSKIKYLPESKEKYDAQSEWGKCVIDTVEQTLKLTVLGKSIKKDEYFTGKEGAKSVYVVPFEDIEIVQLSSKKMKHTVKNSKGEKTVTKKTIFFVYGFKQDGSMISCPFAEGSVFLQIRKIAEYIASSAKVDIRDVTGEDQVIRKHDEINDPWYTKLNRLNSDDFKAPSEHSAFRFERTQDKWVFNTTSSFTNSKNSYFQKLGFGIIGVIWAIGIMLVWMYSDALSFWWTVQYSLLLCVLPFIVRTKIKFTVTAQNVIFEERMLCFRFTEDMLLDQLEEIKVINKSKMPVKKLLLISDHKVLEFTFNYSKKVSILYSFFNNAMGSLKINGFDSPFSKKVPSEEISTYGKIMDQLSWVPTGIAVIALFCILWSFFCTSDSTFKKITLKRLKDVQIRKLSKTLKSEYQKKKIKYSASSPKFMGRGRFKLLDNLYVAKAAFYIRYSWGAEGGYVIHLRVKNLRTGKTVAKVTDEFYVSSWNEESKTEKVYGLVPSFRPEISGDEYQITVIIDPMSTLDKYDLHSKTYRVIVTLRDYGVWKRWGIFFLLLAVFSTGFMGTELMSPKSLILRLIYLYVVYLFLLGSLMATGPVVRKEVGSDGHVHFHLRSRYKGGFFRGGGSGGGK